MSFPKKDRKVQSKSGNSFHKGEGGGAFNELNFTDAIAAALASEWGDSPSAHKSVGRLTKANERAVRNWFDGKNSPSGKNLVHLIRHSDAVLGAVLALSDRRRLLAVGSILALRDHLQEVLDIIDQAPLD